MRQPLTPAVTMGLMLLARAASAQTLVNLPGATLTTTLTAVVSEQARVSVPSAVTFYVNDTSIGTDASPAELQVANVVLRSDTSRLRILAKAGSPAFAPPIPGATTWSASDVSWKAAAWINATPSTGQLAYEAFNSIATCSANAPGCGTRNLVFTLAPKKTVASGQHQLLLIWKIESLDQ